MRKHSLKLALFRFLKSRPNEAINIGELERLAQSEGKIAQNCGRRLRELVNEYPDRITVEYKGEAKSAFYRYKTSPYENYHAQQLTLK